jgi:large subunit ribosomal protein L22
MLRYTNQIKGEKIVRARGIDLPISLKDSVVVCNFLQGLSLNEAKERLKSVIDKKMAVPYKFYMRNVSHQKGMGPARYPVKVSQYIMRVLENLEANAENQDLDIESIKLISILAKKARTVKKYMPRAQGRTTPFFRTRVYVEIIAKEVVNK